MKKEYNVYLGYLIILLGIIKIIIAICITINIINDLFSIFKYSNYEVETFSEVNIVFKVIEVVLAIYSIYILYKKRKNDEELNFGYMLLIGSVLADFIIPYQAIILLRIIPGSLMIPAGILIANDEEENTENLQNDMRKESNE